jgi:hypothetical protein
MPTLLDDTINAMDGPEFGRFDALRIAQELALEITDVARILQRSPSGIRSDRDSRALQIELARLARLVRDLSLLLDDSPARMRFWLRTPHPELGDRAPFDLLLQGQVEAIERLVPMLRPAQPHSVS